ncbi:exonuclease V [Colletotrichum liriopes]|uniref:Exonuclease V n=1 Tax=Colletotrichum liriopes TaxID=708192 RepID=A0AA37GCT1_9PEZI|nr:exonuclease V [Colletotrichum liriopes]
MENSRSLDSDDEYGYDLSLEDETLLSQLITDDPAPTSASSRNPAAPSIASDLGIDTIVEEESLLDDVPFDALSYRSFGTAKGPLRAGGNRDENPAVVPSSSPRHTAVSYPDLNKALSNRKHTHSPPKQAEDASPEPANDSRSPLVRFRSFPRKPFTVTDLTAGAWCELQYFYTLTRLPFGRKTRTAAMKQGTKVHQALEDEVHTTVRVEIASKEDGFGLRIWNLVQGLRTLRDTGMTRELEVWGFVDGNLVNGVIDGLSYENPDPEFQEQLSQDSENQSQASITDYFPAKKQANIPQIYLTDVKTRGSMKAPNSPALLRPAKVQLFLYQRFMSEMAANKLDYLRIFRADSVGRLLAVEYRYRGDGSLIDSQVFPMDDRALNLYLDSTMEWWKADRSPRGVQIEEAYKCRMCEFVGDCTWRSAMDEERLQSTRQRLASSRKHVSSG